MVAGVEALISKAFENEQVIGSVAKFNMHTGAGFLCALLLLLFLVLMLLFLREPPAQSPSR